MALDDNPVRFGQILAATNHGSPAPPMPKPLCVGPACKTSNRRVRHDYFAFRVTILPLLVGRCFCKTRGTGVRR